MTIDSGRWRFALCAVFVLGYPPVHALAAGPVVPAGLEFQVNTYTQNSQNDAAVASDSAGNFVVVWESYRQDGDSFGVFGQRYASTGAPLGTDFQVNTYTPGMQYGPAVASNSSGDFVVVWQSYGQDGDGFGVFGQRYASTGAPAGAEFQVNSYTISFQKNSAVASDSAGNFVVVWQSYPQDGDGYGIFAQRYASTGSPLGTEFQVNTYTIGYQTRPAVASSSVGDFVVVWGSAFEDGSNDGVFGQRYASTGSPLGTEFQVNTYTTGYQRNPAVASDSAGNFVVVWQGYSAQDGDDTGIFGQRYASTGSPLGTEFQINTYTTDYQSRPAVASNSAGDFVVVWHSSSEDGSGDGVFAQRYASSGAAVGTEFQVNSYTTDQQSYPAVAIDGAGGFVVAWQSNCSGECDNGQDGSYAGIFAQRFRPVAAPPAPGPSPAPALDPSGVRLLALVLLVVGGRALKSLGRQR